MYRILQVVAALVLGFALVAIAMSATGFRLAVDGSGKLPRFLTRSSIDALEADRARQRELLPAQAEPVAPGAASPQQVVADVGTKVTPAVSTPQSSQSESAAATPAGARAAWPDFRGPDRDGRYMAAPIRTTWPREGLAQLWKQPVGGGYASFVAADGRAFTIEQRRDREVVAAYDVQTGREVWTNAWPANFRESMGGDGPRATPTYEAGRVYALGAEGELRALDAAKGTVIWRHNILSENGASNPTWGMSASPLVVDDKLIVLPGGTRGSSIVAYDKATGNLIWKAQNDEPGYTSPMLVTLAGVRQILVVSASRAMGVTVDDGRLLWEYPWSTFNGINVAQPILFSHDGADRIFLSASYGRGAAVFELTRSGDAFQTKTIWENQRMKNKFSSSVLHNGFIYGLDESILTCLDANTGEQKWKGGRYGYGQIMLAGDHVVVLTEDGQVVLVKATPDRHEEVARFEALTGKTWNHPVIVSGRLLVRNSEEMAAYAIQ